MNKRFAIFDMDGTLIDSMPIWRGLGAAFLRAHGVSPPEDLRKALASQTLAQTAEYFKKLGVKGTINGIIDALNDYMRVQYETTIDLREDVLTYLDALKSAGVRCCVATATNQELAQICLERLKIINHFEFIMSCETIGKGKTDPAVYDMAAKRLGAAPADIAVYEDAPYAAETAKRAGYYVIGVYDPSAKHHQQRLRLASDCYLIDYAAAAAQIANTQL